MGEGLLWLGVPWAVLTAVSIRGAGDNSTVWLTSLGGCEPQPVGLSCGCCRAGAVPAVTPLSPGAAVGLQGAEVCGDTWGYMGICGDTWPPRSFLVLPGCMVQGAVQGVLQ